jgi:hypothetical protein
MIGAVRLALHKALWRWPDHPVPEHDDALGEVLRRGASHDLSSEVLMTIL